MGRHILLDIIALADEGKTREEIAAIMNVDVQSVSNRLAYARKKGHVFNMPPRKKRVTKRALGELPGLGSPARSEAIAEALRVRS
jgi:predicted transcriptional regulator